jgi:hypothetical protein
VLTHSCSCLQLFAFFLNFFLSVDQVKLWRVKKGDISSSDSGVNFSVLEECTINAFNSPVTAVAFAPLATSGDQHRLLLAVGLDNGEIELWQGEGQTAQVDGPISWSWTLFHKLEERYAAQNKNTTC